MTDEEIQWLEDQANYAKKWLQRVQMYPDTLLELIELAKAAQRPRLGYVTVDLQSENPPSLIEADREIASRQLADDRAASPLGDWVLLEVREVQP